MFELSRYGGGWVLTNLYTFQGGSDGAQPQARVVFGPDGTLYGTTTAGGRGVGAGGGTVFNLRPPVSVCQSPHCS